MEINNSNLGTENTELQEKRENDVASVSLNSPLSRCKDPSETETLPDQFENSMTALLELQKEVSRIDSFVTDKSLPEKSSSGSSNPEKNEKDETESLKNNDNEEEPQKTLVSTESTNINTEDIISTQYVKPSQNDKVMAASNQDMSALDTTDNQKSTDEEEKTKNDVSQITTNEQKIVSVDASGDNVGKKEHEVILSPTHDTTDNQKSINEQENTNVDVKNNEKVAQPFICEDKMDSTNEGNKSMSKNSEIIISQTQDSDDNKEDNKPLAFLTKTRSSSRKQKKQSMSKKVTIKKRVPFVPKILVVRLERMDFKKTSSAVNINAIKEEKKLCIKLEKIKNIQAVSTIVTDLPDTKPSILQPTMEEKTCADDTKMDSVEHPGEHGMENKLAILADTTKNMSDSLVLVETKSLSGNISSENEATQSIEANIAADEKLAQDKPVIDLNDKNNEHTPQSDNPIESVIAEAVVKLSDTAVDLAHRRQLRKKTLRPKKKISRKTSAKVSVRSRMRKTKVTSRHVKRLYFCEICSLSFNCIRRYWNHKNLVHHDHNFDCSLCDKKFKKTSSLLHHNKFRHKGADEKESETVKDSAFFYCEACGEGFRNIQKRVSHIQDVHKDGYIFCTLCDHTSSNIDDLVFHAKTHKKFKNTLFSCKICGQNIFFLQMFLQHIHGHGNVSSSKNFYCKICCTKIEEYEKFLTHMQVHLFTKPKYYCFICNKVFLFNKKLELHIKFQHQKYYHLYKKFLTLKENQDDAGKFDCYCCGQNMTDKGHKKHLLMHKSFWLTLKNQPITNIAKVFIKKSSRKVLKTHPALQQELTKNECKGLKPKRAETKTNDDFVSSTKIKEVTSEVKSIEEVKTENKASKMEENKIPDKQIEKTDDIFKKPATPPIKKLSKEVIQPAIDKSKVTIIERKFDLTGTSEAFKKVDDVLSTKEEATENKIDEKPKKTADNNTSTKTKEKKKSRFSPIEPTAIKVVTIKKTNPPKTPFKAPTPGPQMNQGPFPRGPFVGPPFGGPFPRGPPGCPPFRGPPPFSGPPGGPPFRGPPGGPPFRGPPGGPQFGGPPGGPNFGGRGGPIFVRPPGQNFGGPSGPNFGGSGGPNFIGPGGPNFAGPSGPNFGEPAGQNIGGPGGLSFVPPPKGPPPSGFNTTIHPSSQTHPGQNQSFPPNANMTPNFGPPGVDHPGTIINQPFGGSAPINQGIDMSHPQQSTDPSSLQEKFFNHPGFINQLKQVHGGSGDISNQGLPVMDLNQFGYNEQNMAIYMAQWQAQQNLAQLNQVVMPNFGIAPPDIIKAPVLSTKCSGCQKKFPNIKVLGVHEIFCAKLTDKLIQQKQHTCSVCSQKFSKLGVIKQHMFIAHAQIFKQLNLITGKEQNVETNQCTTCKQTFNNKENLKAHEKTHEFLQSLQADLSKAQASATISKAPQLVSDIRASTTTPSKGNIPSRKFDIPPPIPKNKAQEIKTPKPDTNILKTNKNSKSTTRERQQAVKNKKDELKAQSYYKKAETSTFKQDKTQKPDFKQTSSVQQKLNQTLRQTQELEISRKIKEHQLFESMKAAAVKKNPEPSKKKLKINLLYFQKQKLEQEKQVKNLEMLKAEQELQKIQKQLIESQILDEREEVETIDLTESHGKQKMKEDKSKIGERSRKKRSKSRSPVRTRRSRSRSRENRSSTTKSSKERRRSTERDKKQKVPRRSRSRSKGRRRISPSPKTSRRRSRSRSIERKAAAGSKTKPAIKSQQEAGAYRCPKCATLFTNYRDFIVHKDAHEDSSEDEENYLTLLDPPPPPVISGNLKHQSNVKATYDMFKKQQDSSDSDDGDKVSYNKSVSKQKNRSQFAGPSFLQKQKVGGTPSRSFSSAPGPSSESAGASRLSTAYAHLQPKQKHPVRVECQVCSIEFPGQEYLDYHNCPGPF